MPWYLAFAEHVLRTALLLALTVAPTALSPEPPPSQNLPFFGLLSVMALGALLYGAAWFARFVDTRRAQVAAALVWVAVAIALVATRFYSGAGAPLARAVPLMAIPVWGALAAVASAAGDRWLGSSWKHRRMAPVVVVLCAGALQLAGASKLLGSTETMWWSALRRDGDHARALEALTAAPRKARKFDELVKVADRCLRTHPDQCGCLELKADAAIRGGGGDPVTTSRAAAERCPTGPARAMVAQALAGAGQAVEAEVEARAALAAGGPEPQLRYALGLALERQGRYPEAMAETEKAIELGAGRDAKLFAGGLLILAGNLDGAEKVLEPLAAADASDADARYNLGLVSDKRNHYNKARERYLAALKADPKHANARYNLALLTYRNGVVEESRHHVKKLAEAWPKDPRLAELARSTGTPLR